MFETHNFRLNSNYKKYIYDKLEASDNIRTDYLDKEDFIKLFLGFYFFYCVQLNLTSTFYYSSHVHILFTLPNLTNAIVYIHTTVFL